MTTAQTILYALAGQTLSMPEIALIIGTDELTTRRKVYALIQDDEVRAVKGGKYELAHGGYNPDGDSAA